jgi:deoxyuridine 5'-triphosphate nucleotidohydrolase
VVSNMIIEKKNQVLILMNIVIKIPEGYFELIKLRSGLVLKKKITIDVRVIDADYRKDIQVLLVNRYSKKFQVEKKNRIAQLLLVKNAMSKVKEVTELPKTDWGERRFRLTDDKKIRVSARVLHVGDLEKTDINSNLTDEQKKKKKNLLLEFRDLFINKITEMNHTYITEYKINFKLKA